MTFAPANELVTTALNVMTFEGTTFRGKTFEGKTFRGNYVSRGHHYKGVSFIAWLPVRGENLPSVKTFRGETFEGNFSRGTFRGETFQGKTFREGTFRG